MNADLKLQWQKGVNGWIALDNLNLKSNDLNDVTGIYILWSGDRIVKIGSGRIRDEIAKDKTNREIAETEGLMVTWSEVHPDRLDGIIRYLVGKLKPEIADMPWKLGKEEICVNDPWAG